MKNDIRKIIVCRVFELLSSSIILSLICIVLNFTKVIITFKTLTLCLSLAVVIFMIFNCRMMRECYFELRSKNLYYMVNISAYIIFVVITVLIKIIAGNGIFTWLFAITKFGIYNIYGISIAQSALIFHIIGIITIFLAPIGMDWIYNADD